MRRIVLSLTLVSAAGAALAAACATGIVAIDPPDASLDGSACPQFDLTKDPKHCGSCDNACPSGQVCSQGQCKAQCDAPTTKCSSADGGVSCVDTKTDPQHCGQCGTKCGVPDAGALQQGTNNPDAGVAYDAGGGPFASGGTPACTAGACGVTCPGTMTKCTDGFCWDTQNHHDHCGDCSTACAANEWCALGHCCGAGKLWCGGACVDVQSSATNCGGCGITCSGATPYCSAGKCTMGCTPTGTRQAFNTLQSSTTTGCWNGNPCGQDAYNFSNTYGKNFQANGQELVCSGASACVGHVGVGTYTSTTVCQGAWDVYCDGVNVGNLNTVGKACTGSAMANGCNVTFTPRNCTSIKLVATAGSGTLSCCAGNAPDSMIVAVSAW